jgi:two-component system, sensor histidine kinase and response regulator
MKETRIRVLIVDDDEPLMAALAASLRKRGYDTTGFTSAGKALTALDQSSFDLLLTDLTMPEMDGIQLIRAALAKDPQLAAIIVTGAGTVETAVEAMKAGAFDYILKPIKLNAVLVVLQRAMAVRSLRLENLALEAAVRERSAELEEANRELEAFSYSVSHDLRAPLRAVKMFSEILTQRHAPDLSDEARRMLHYVNQGANEMNRLIEALLRFSRLSRQPLSKSQVDMYALARHVLLQLAPEHAERKADIHVEELPPSWGDESLLKQVYVNLLSNAFKFTRQRETAKVEIGSFSENGELIYFVRDNGAGFDMQYAKDLFGVFRRLHTQDQFEGTGIGLSIVHRIVKRHGGRVWAEGQNDHGAAFYFTLAPAPGDGPRSTPQRNTD